MTAKFIFVTEPRMTIHPEVYKDYPISGISMAVMAKAYKKVGLPTNGTLWERVAEEKKNFGGAHE